MPVAPLRKRSAVARFSAPSPEESVSCNVVPLLDVMFLLLIFLMIGSDMSHAEAAQLVLPKASAADEQPEVAPERFVTLNVAHRSGAVCAANDAERPCHLESHFVYSIQGREFDADALAGRLAAVAADALEPETMGARRLSSVTLSIRCDRAAPYGMVQQALSLCSEAGIHRTEIAASRPARE